MIQYGRNTKKGLIAELSEQGKTKRETFGILRQLVEAQESPFIYKRNPDRAIGERHRIPLPISEQLIALKNDIGRVYSALGRAASPDFDAEEIEPVEPEEDEEEEQDEEEEDDEKPTAKGKARVKSELAKFLRRVREIRAFCVSRAALSEPLDFISVRPAQAASRLIPAGIPADALIAAMTLHWPQDARNDARIEEFDFVKLSAEILAEREIDPAGKHKLFGYVLVLAENRQPIFLVGPHGTGKSHIARQVAEFLGLDYGETPMTSGATRGDLLGRFTASPDRPFIAARFDEIYGKGGVFNFEEIDAADPSMLIVLNNALAGERFYNSNSGEMIPKSEDFIAMSTANTFGLGATREYTARERLDAATIDRWRMGRVWIDLDETVEEMILYS